MALLPMDKSQNINANEIEGPGFFEALNDGLQKGEAIASMMRAGDIEKGSNTANKLIDIIKNEMSSKEAAVITAEVKNNGFVEGVNMLSKIATGEYSVPNDVVDALTEAQVEISTKEIDPVASFLNDVEETVIAKKLVKDLIPVQQPEAVVSADFINLEQVALDNNLFAERIKILFDVSEPAQNKTIYIHSAGEKYSGDFWDSYGKSLESSPLTINSKSLSYQATSDNPLKLMVVAPTAEDEMPDTASIKVSDDGVKREEFYGCFNHADHVGDKFSALKDGWLSPMIHKVGTWFGADWRTEPLKMKDHLTYEGTEEKGGGTYHKFQYNWEIEGGKTPVDSNVLATEIDLLWKTL